MAEWSIGTDFMLDLVSSPFRDVACNYPTAAARWCPAAVRLQVVSVSAYRVTGPDSRAPRRFRGNRSGRLAVGMPRWSQESVAATSANRESVYDAEELPMDARDCMLDTIAAAISKQWIAVDPI